MLGRMHGGEVFLGLQGTAVMVPDLQSLALLILLHDITCSRGLSQRIATYCNRLTGESDSLAVEVSWGGAAGAPVTVCMRAWQGVLPQVNTMLISCAIVLIHQQHSTNEIKWQSTQPPTAQVKSLQQAIASAEKAAMAHPDAIAASDALADLRTAKEVITGLGPGGDL